ncbi:MAG: HPr kinase/phosphorylase, partial [Oscillospiraceae bacterium]
MSANSKKYNVSLAKIIEEFDLEKVSMPIDPNSILIDENDVTRPGLQLMGFYEYFNHERIQVIGNMEHAYLETLSQEERTSKLEELFSHKIPALIITRELPCFDEMIELSKKYSIT